MWIFKPNSWPSPAPPLKMPYLRFCMVSHNNTCEDIAPKQVTLVTLRDVTHYHIIRPTHHIPVSFYSLIWLNHCFALLKQPSFQIRSENQIFLFKVLCLLLQTCAVLCKENATYTDRQRDRQTDSVLLEKSMCILLIENVIALSYSLAKKYISLTCTLICNEISDLIILVKISFKIFNIL